MDTARKSPMNTGPEPKGLLSQKLTGTMTAAVSTVRAIRSREGCKPTPRGSRALEPIGPWDSRFFSTMEPSTQSRGHLVPAEMLPTRVEDRQTYELEFRFGPSDLRIVR